MESTDGAEKMGTAVKLDTVVNIIDSVSEGMTLFKERVRPQAVSFYCKQGDFHKFNFIERKSFSTQF